MNAIPRFQATKDGSLTDPMRTAWERDGVLVIEGFASKAECDGLMARIGELVDAYDPAEPGTVFETGGQSHAAEDDFKTSGDKVRLFFEADAFDDNGQFAVDRHQAVNKVGHALHDLDPFFDRFSRKPALARLANDVGLADPGLIQSMFIVKPARIGGEVGCHQDATFLHTEPQSCTGFWFALEDATLKNGCLQAVPGAHKAALKERFRYSGDDLLMEQAAEQGWNDADAAPLEAPAGTLIVLHGHLPHFSGPNTSDQSRRAYALHLIDRAAKWSPDNWLRRAADMPVRGF